ncbi:GNAT family N-acetyltransferase [Clostridium perfringens]|nr:GNAT family N-acetyltransferase [Clostridium perfringens]
MGCFNIRFREMSDDEFIQFIESSILDYSQDLIKSGMCSKEVGFERSKKQFNELLPQGKYTENNFFYIVVNSKNEYVGTIWYSKYNERVAFIANILIYEKFRKKGYGKQTLLLLHNEVKEKGFNKILLHVFKFNSTAFSLYSSLGYKVVEENPGGMHMVKNI